MFTAYNLVALTEVLNETRSKIGLDFASVYSADFFFADAKTRFIIMQERIF